jgi:RNA polymerase sigma factor (sigma-70 family)
MHLLAVSGLHVGMVATGLWLLLRIIRMPRWGAALLVIAAVWLYAALTGLRVPALRASWLFTVTRNRITDYYRKKKPESFSDKQVVSKDADGAPLMLEDILPALTRDPEDEMMRDMIWEAIDDALDEMPEEQRDVFIWNEFEDRSFKEISSATGEGINTLLSRKRYAILFLRKRLQELYNQL